MGPPGGGGGVSDPPAAAPSTVAASACPQQLEAGVRLTALDWTGQSWAVLAGMTGPDLT